ncbi:MAG: DUF1659 domain-containing protein [Syntrophomonadaceae bacterium]|jgi:hypothetical protein
MAIVVIPVASDLVLIMDDGLDENGKPLTKKRQYGDLKTSATDEDVFAIAEGILSLQDGTCLAVQRVNTVELTES